MPTTSDYLTQLQQDREDLVDNLETQGIDDLTGDETFTELVPRVLDIEGGGGSSARLPSEYQEVEYIGITDGNGYIDTEFIPTYYSKAVARGSMTSGTFLLGEDTSWANKGFGILARYSYFSNKWSSIAMVLNNVHDFEVSKDGYYIDEVLKDSFSSANTFTADYSLYVFANHRGGSADEYGKGTIYSLELYENGTLKRYFVPCYEKATNIIGLYDLVYQKFHGSQGSGTWVKGEDHDTPVVINLQTKDVTINSNTTTSVTPDIDYSGLERVNITTNVLPNLQNKNITINSNTTTNITADSGYDGLNSVSVVTNVKQTIETYLIKDGRAQIPYTYTKAGGSETGSFTENYNSQGYAYAYAKTWSEYRLSFGTFPINSGDTINVKFKKTNNWTGSYSQYGGGYISLVPSSGTTSKTSFVKTNETMDTTTYSLSALQDYADFYVVIENLTYASTDNNYGICIYDLWIEKQPSLNLQEKNITVTESGTVRVEPDAGYDGLSAVNITINV